jgi:hypothetical protein
MANQLSTLAKALPFAVTSYVDGEQSVAGGIYVSVTVTASVAGQVTLNSTAEVSHEVPNEGGVNCKIVKAADVLSSFKGESGQRFMNHGLVTKGTLSGTRTFDIAAGTVVKYGLACAAVQYLRERDKGRRQRRATSASVEHVAPESSQT